MSRQLNPSYSKSTKLNPIQLEDWNSPRASKCVHPIQGLSGSPVSWLGLLASFGLFEFLINPETNTHTQTHADENTDKNRQTANTNMGGMTIGLFNCIGQLG